MTDLPREEPRPRFDQAAPPPPSGPTVGELPPPPPASDASRAAFLPARQRRGVALCLSGGGYRAALFHLGAVRRLNELGVLGSIDTLSSVSGGSILAAHLATSMGPSWPAPGAVFADFDTRVAAPFHAFCRRNIRTWPLLVGLAPWNLFRGHAAVSTLEATYAEHLTPLRLTELPVRPRFVLCATDLAYGVNWTFTRDEVGSYMAGYVSTPAAWSLARAVAASSCFPPFFNPQPVGLKPEVLVDGRDPAGAERDGRVKSLSLSDGGLYDNMGLEPVWKSHAVVLVSDGGSTFDAGADSGLLWRLSRYVDVQGRQSAAVRKRWLISNFVDSVLRGTYWGIGTDIAKYEIPATGYSAELTGKVIAEMRTDMDRFEDAERFVLENHGYLLADAAIRKYVDFLAVQPILPAAPPHPQWMDQAAVATALAESNQRRFPFGRGFWS